jgi:hypothetical protein
MLRFLKRWLGWDDDLEYFDPEDFKPAPRPRSATASVLSGKPRKPVKQAKSRREPARLDVDEEPARPQFDPYNTGKFDRSASWDRIGKNNR